MQTPATAKKKPPPCPSATIVSAYKEQLNATPLSDIMWQSEISTYIAFYAPLQEKEGVLVVDVT